MMATIHFVNGTTKKLFDKHAEILFAEDNMSNQRVVSTGERDTDKKLFTINMDNVLFIEYDE